VDSALDDRIRWTSPLRERIAWLFSSRKKCLIDIAVIFASRPGEWLTVEQLIDLKGKEYSNKTIYNNVVKLSKAMSELNDHNYIDKMFFKNGRGRTSLGGRLSEAAAERLFSYSSDASEEKPLSIILRLCGLQVEIPPLGFDYPSPKGTAKSASGTSEKSYIPPGKVLALRKQKIGENATNKRLREMLDTRADNGESPYVGRSRIKISEHKVGRFPKRVCLKAISIEQLATDRNERIYSIDSVVKATKGRSYQLDVIIAGPDSEPLPDTEPLDMVGPGMYGLDLAEDLPKKACEPKES